MTDLSEEARLAGIEAELPVTPERAVEPVDDTPKEGVHDDVCRRCGKQERIHVLDFSVCDDCRALGFGSNPAGEKLRFLSEDRLSFEVLASW